MTVKLDKLELPPNERHIMSRSAITIVKNFGTADYRYQDRHVDDTQGTESFLAVRNGWKASYHIHSDTWHVSTPSGLQRTYERVR